MKLNTKIFGETIYSKEDGLNFDTVMIDFNGKRNACSGMVFEGLTNKQIEMAESLVNSLEQLDKKARELFLEFYEEERGVVAPFVHQHFNEYGSEIRARIFEKLQITEQNDRVFLENLEFGSFSISKDDKNEGIWITMDYNLIWEDGWTFTDQILAIRFNEKLEYTWCGHES